MLRQLVAGWLREQAQQTLVQNLNLADDEQAGPPPSNIDIAVIMPSRTEAGGLLDRLQDVHTNRCDGFVEHLARHGEQVIALLEAPVTRERLAAIARDVIQLRQPKWVMISGFVTGLQRQVRKGDVVMARRIIDENGYSLETGLQLDDAALQATRGVHAGTLLSVAQLPGSVPEKRDLAQRHVALVCDRQAAVIAEVCRLKQVPVLSVHGVVEGLDEISAHVVQRLKSQSTWSAKLGVAAGALIKQPSSVKQFWQDKETALRLSDRLAAFLAEMLGQLKTTPDTRDTSPGDST